MKDTGFDSIKKSLGFYNVEPERYIDLVEEYLNGKIDEDYFLKTCYSLFNKKGAKYIEAKEVCDLTSYKHDYLRKLISYHNGKTKFVFIERNIRGVVSSFIKLGFFPPGKRRLCNLNLKRFAKQYIKCMNYIDENLPKNNTHFLTFEDLMLYPYKELSKIFNFLGVNSSPEIVDKILNTPSRGIRQNYTGLQEKTADGWQINLTEKQIVWLDRLYNNKRVMFHVK